MTATIAILAGVTALSYGVQTVTGFGAVLIAVTVGAFLMPIPELLLYLLPLSLLQCTYITIRHRAAIDWRLLSRWIIPIMGTGTAIGALIAGQVSGSTLRRALAVIILALSAFELYSLTRRAPTTAPPGGATTAIGLLGAGLMHGVYATGGPLLVYAIGRRVSDKAVFRSTLTIVWLLLNTGLITYFLVGNRYHDEHPLEIAMLVPGVVVAIAIGERLHAAIDTLLFRRIIFALLAAAALALLIR